jgi:hypothetical protein
MCPSRPFCIGFPNLEFPEESFLIFPRSAVQHAVKMENMELVNLLIDAGTDINVPTALDSRATALQIASILGSMLIVQYLVNLGANLYAVHAAKHGKTALQGAAKQGRKDVVELLLMYAAPKTCEHRKQIVEAAFCAEMNGHRVVASILRESLSPRWSSKDEETTAMLEEDWETSSEHSVCWDSFNKVLSWEKNNPDWSQAVEAHESSSGSWSYVENESVQVEESASPHGTNTSSPWQGRWEVENLDGFEVTGHNDTDLYHSEVASAPIFQVGDSWEMLLDDVFDS